MELKAFHNVFRNHFLLLLYFLMLCLLSYGMVQAGGTKYLSYPAGLAAIVLILYIPTQWLIKRIYLSIHRLSLSPGAADRLSHIAVGVIIFLIITHFLLLGHIPALKALASINYLEIAAIRQESTLSIPLLSYVYHILIKAIIPFFIFYFLIRRKYLLFYTLIAMGLIYAVAMMQKSFVLFVLVPPLLCALLQMRILISALMIVLAGACISLMVFISNPQLRTTKELPKTTTSAPMPTKTVTTTTGRSASVFSSIYRRVMIVPGEVVVEWFDNIPEVKPFLNGCGYRFLAPLLNCQFRNYAVELYPVLHPKWADSDLKGTVNTAHFMYDYANFGWKGMLVSGFMVVILISGIRLIFHQQYLHEWALNSFFIILLSSTAVTTLLLTGGWATMVILYLLFYKSLAVNDR